MDTRQKRQDVVPPDPTKWVYSVWDTVLERTVVSGGDDNAAALIKEVEPYLHVRGSVITITRA